MVNQCSYLEKQCGNIDIEETTKMVTTFNPALLLIISRVPSKSTVGASYPICLNSFESQIRLQTVKYNVFYPSTVSNVFSQPPKARFMFKVLRLLGVPYWSVMTWGMPVAGLQTHFLSSFQVICHWEGPPVDVYGHHSPHVQTLTTIPGPLSHFLGPALCSLLINWTSERETQEQVWR